MSRVFACAAYAAGLSVITPLLAIAQQPPAAPTAPDSPSVVQQIAGLKATVGPRWQDAVRFWCEAPRANRPDDPAIEPTQIFDNVYANPFVVGRADYQQFVNVMQGCSGVALARRGR
jgi:hypothetical protein